jgi:hypothetical protein
MTKVEYTSVGELHGILILIHHSDSGDEKVTKNGGDAPNFEFDGEIII